uniref:Wsv390-like protein n=1 Tax=Trachysalambria curvirostris nimavirus TaxID=2984282 RepID=A0A9C7F8C1_9VIRU|nr:MAG: wsv390-like protein [Trachysalambria curvirostris nimavirus]
MEVVNIELGEEKIVGNTPIVSLKIPKGWCTSASCQRISSSLDVKKDALTADLWGRFGGLLGYSELMSEVQYSPKVCEHLAVVEIKMLHGADRAENGCSLMEFNICLDNTLGDKSQLSVAHIYSHQDKKIIIGGIKVEPGMTSTLGRFEDEEKSFSLFKHTDKIDQEFAIKHTDLAEKNARDTLAELRRSALEPCSFTLMVVCAKRPKLRCSIDDGDSNYNNVVSGTKAVSSEYDSVTTVHFYNIVLLLTK